MSLILSGTDGLSDVDGTAATPAIRGTDANTGIFFGTDIIGFSEGGAECARFDSSGNFGIGTASPNPTGFTAPVLSITNGTSGIVELIGTQASNGTVGQIAFYNTSSSVRIAQILGLRSGANNSGALTFQTNNAGTLGEVGRFDSSGNLGIGTTSPSDTIGYGRALDIQSSTGAAIYLRDSDNPTTQYGAIAFDGNASVNNLNIINSSSTGPIRLFTNGAERARIDSSGNLLVGTTSATGKVEIQYDGGVVVGQNINDSANTTNSTLVQFLIQGTQVGTIKRVGATSAVVYNTASDYRLKNVTGAVTGQGDRIDALKPIDYLWKEGNTQARGFLAHEFQAVYPNSVSGDKDDVDTNNKPMYQAMQASTSEVMADLVAEIQSLRKRLAALESA